MLSQTHRPIEIIIVDDGSDDDETPLSIAKLVGENPDVVKVHRIENGGPGAARQAGLEIAVGDFVQFLDSDDLLEPSKFERQLAVLEAKPNCGAAYGQTREHVTGEEPNDRPIKRTGERIETMFPAHLRSRWWSTSTPLYRREVLDAAGPWTALRNEEDWEFECRIAAQGVKLAFVEEILSTTRYHGSEHLSEKGSSDPKKLKDRAEAHRLILGHAKRAGISATAPEMQHFARELFLLSRQCGAAGLAPESKMLFEIAREASTSERASRLDFRLYKLAARVFGWKIAGLLSKYLDSVRQFSGRTERTKHS